MKMISNIKEDPKNQKPNYSPAAQNKTHLNFEQFNNDDLVNYFYDIIIKNKNKEDAKYILEQLDLLIKNTKPNKPMTSGIRLIKSNWFV